MVVMLAMIMAVAVIILLDALLTLWRRGLQLCLIGAVATGSVLTMLGGCQIGGWEISTYPRGGYNAHLAREEQRRLNEEQRRLNEAARNDQRDYYKSILEACGLEYDPDASLGTLAGQVAAIPISDCPSLSEDAKKYPGEDAKQYPVKSGQEL